VTSAIAALQAGERHSIEDREMLRREIHDSEQRILERVNETRGGILERVNAVDDECKRFRREAKQAWESREKRSASITVAWIGGAAILLAAIVNTIAVLTGG
jgi:hypothetical protein